MVVLRMWYGMSERFIRDGAFMKVEVNREGRERIE